MTEKHKNILMSNYKKLVNLNAGDVMDSLIERGIITSGERKSIYSQGESKDRSRALLDFLVDRQDDAFNALIEALKESGSPDLAGILEREGRQICTNLLMSVELLIIYINLRRAGLPLFRGTFVYTMITSLGVYVLRRNAITLLPPGE